MKGLIIEQDNDNNTICIVEDFSNELKELIRKNLNSICQGVARGESGKVIYSYKNTLKEFLFRYDSKGNTEQGKNTKKGIIGELLSHILFIAYFNEFKTVSPLFNMEDRNIKKSFDVILLHTSEQAMYYTEVKSGSVKNESSDTKNANLLSIAKSDILEKLNENNDNNWLNAINGATIALDNKNIKKEIINILEGCLADSQNGTSDSETKNVILVSVTYNNITDKITLSRVYHYKSNIKSTDFNSSVLFSIQKDTYESIESFLRNEAND